MLLVSLFSRNKIHIHQKIYIYLCACMERGESDSKQLKYNLATSMLGADCGIFLERTKAEWRNRLCLEKDQHQRKIK